MKRHAGERRGRITPEILNPKLRFVRLNAHSEFIIRKPLWLSKIDALWAKAPIVWLSGMRRVRKTIHTRSLPDAEFLNCDLPSAQMRLGDPEAFYRSLSKPCLIPDEVH